MANIIVRLYQSQYILKYIKIIAPVPIGSRLRSS